MVCVRCKSKSASPETRICTACLWELVKEEKAKQKKGQGNESR